MGEKIISREVVGSSNPFARFFRDLGNSIKGIFIGLLLIIISFVVIYFSANQTEHSKTIEDLPMMTPQEAYSVEGMVKISGEPSYDSIVVAPYAEEDVLYYTYTKEEYAVREIEKTRTITEDGQEIRETYVEYKPDWETVETTTEWSDFRLGDIEIVPDDAKARLRTDKLYSETVDQDYPKYRDEEDLVDIPQRVRHTVVGVPVDEESLIIVGSNSGGRIASGIDGTFFISNKTEAALVADQAHSEQMTRWIMWFIGWLMMTIGFTMLFGPITYLLNIIPGLGSLTKGILFIIFGIISAILLFIAYIGFKFWWLIGILIIAALGFVVYKRYSVPEPKSIKSE